MKKTFVCGIDPSSYKLAATITTPLDPTVVMRTATLNKTNKAKASAQAFSFIEDIVFDYKNAELQFYIEAPVYVPGRGGIKAVIPQSIIDGAMLAAIGTYNFRAEMIANTSWKAKVLGKGFGHASKIQIADFLLQAWPLAFEEANGDQDLLDSACINRYGEQVRARAEKMTKRNTLQPPKIRRTR